MGYISCPSCARRLQVPDGAEGSPLRCPVCKHAFKMGPAGAGGNGGGKDDNGFDFGAVGGRRILSAEDEAMLREFGSGSGLLELTRDALDVPHPSATRGAGPAAKAAPAPAEAPQLDKQSSDRQFQIVGVALTMANKLVQVYKAELARARRIAVIAWSAVGVAAVAAFIVFWWGMVQAGKAGIDRSTSIRVEKHLADEKANAARTADDLAAARSRADKLQTDLERSRAEITKAQEESKKAADTARDESKKAQADVSDARASVAKSDAAVQVMKATLDMANARVSELEAQIGLMRNMTSTPATSRPATSILGMPTPGATTRKAFD